MRLKSSASAKSRLWANLRCVRCGICVSRLTLSSNSVARKYVALGILMELNIVPITSRERPGRLFAIAAYSTAALRPFVTSTPRSCMARS